MSGSLSRITSLLANELTAHEYRAGSPTFVRAAKGLGLTRPVAHLSFSDSLVYRAIVVQSQNSLAQATPSWARMGRRDAADGDLGGESGWFRAWLARQKKIWVMTEMCDWLVESDIANYFPTIGIPQVCDYVRAQSSLSDESVRLLRHVLERLSPLVEYRTLPSGGLAQEFSDSSRVIAHAYLSSLDHAFSVEGDAGRFTRWVDDIIVGADTWPEALMVVKRIQLELEKLGLYPNAAKTRIYRRGDFVRDYMKVENDFLGLVEDENPLTSARRQEFQRRLHTHIQMPEPRPKGWARVTRRYYTNSRRLGDTYLLGNWTRHLSTNPESAAHILEYLRTFPLTTKRVRDLSVVLDQFGGVYEDVEIFAMEFAATAPISRDPAVRDQVTDFALRRISDRATYGHEVAAAAAVAVARLGTRNGMTSLRRLLPELLISDTSLRRQILPIAFGLDWLDEDSLRKAGFNSEREGAWQIEFLLAVAHGDKKAMDMAFSVLKPTQRQSPSRWAVRPRLMFLAPLVARSDRSRYAAELGPWLQRLMSNDQPLRDRCAEGWYRFALHRSP